MASPACPVSSSRRRPWLALGILVGTALLLHGHGLTFGFFFDDHNHLELCHRHGYAGLARGNRFDWNHGIVRVWWAAKDTGWAYFRPVPVLLRVTWLRLFGLHPLPFHVIHLLQYLTILVLFFGLLRRCGLGLWPCLVGGLLFTMHPTHAQVAPWLSSDTSVLTGLGFVSALWFLRASVESGHRRPVLLAGVFACYALAMLSRETGLMLGPVLVVFDWLWTGRSAERRPWRLYMALALEGILYLGVRWLFLEKAPLPRSPYFHWPTEVGFAGWLPYKLLSDSFCLTLGFPFIPIAEVPWLQARPVATSLAVAGVLMVIWVFLWPLRRCRAMWGILASMALTAAPTVLVFSTAYNYFLISAGWAALLAVWTASLWPSRPRLVAGTLGVLASLYLVGLWAGGWQMRAAGYADQCVSEEVLATNPASYPQGTQLLFLNMPLFASEVGPALRVRLDRPDLAVFPLTYAPEPFAPRQFPEIHQEDAHTLLVRMQGAGWFPGILGEHLQLGWFGSSRSQLPLGPVVLQPAAGAMPFRVEVVQQGPDGIQALRFIFEKPLDDPYYRFFVSHPFRPAQPWHPGDRSPSPSLDPRLAVRSGRMQRMQMALEHVGNFLHGCP